MGRGNAVLKRFQSLRRHNPDQVQRVLLSLDNKEAPLGKRLKVTVRD